MQWLKLRSRAIMLIGYDFGASRLFVMFDGGAFYTYEKVGYDVVEDFFAAEAPGALITSRLRDRSFSSKQQGVPTVSALVSRALAMGLHSIGRNVHDSRPRSIDALGPVSLADLEAYLEGDDDCTGEHRFLIVPEPSANLAYVWHFNADTGLIVPPEPRILHRRKVRRQRVPVAPPIPASRARQVAGRKAAPAKSASPGRRGTKPAASASVSTASKPRLP